MNAFKISDFFPLTGHGLTNAYKFHQKYIILQRMQADLQFSIVIIFK